MAAESGMSPTHLGALRIEKGVEHLTSEPRFGPYRPPAPGFRLPEVQEVQVVPPPRQEPEFWTDLSSPPPPQLPTPRQHVDVAQTASEQQVWSRGQMKRGERHSQEEVQWLKSGGGILPFLHSEDMHPPGGSHY